MKLIESFSKKSIMWIIIAAVVALYIAAVFFMWPVNITELVEFQNNLTVLLVTEDGYQQYDLENKTELKDLFASIKCIRTASKQIFLHPHDISLICGEYCILLSPKQQIVYSLSSKNSHRIYKFIGDYSWIYHRVYGLINPVE